MLSLLDVFSREEVDEFVNSTIKELGEDTEFLVETKIDGLSMALRYENGKLVTAVTRGDGITAGEDVTKNAMVIKDVVKTMPDPIEYIEIRGEVYMTRERRGRRSGKQDFRQSAKLRCGNASSDRYESNQEEGSVALYIQYPGDKGNGVQDPFRRI